ncbi:MAG: nitroreductase family protein, partial [Chloroflexi bacterium]|nr:nitroreductase family protein [Chloroflexota bacterium]
MNYEQFHELLMDRRTIRRFKPDPVPDDYIMKILDAGHYAMSGANSQPWEFIVVKDPKTREKIFNAYSQHFELMYYLEQMRIPEYRHPAFNVAPEEKDKAHRMAAGWKDAPVFIIVLEDARKIYGAVLGARGDFKTEGSKGFGASMG